MEENIWNLLARSAWLSVLGLIVGILLSILLVIFSIKWKGSFIGKMISIGLKCVPAFIFPLLLSSYISDRDLMKVLVSGLICFFPIYMCILESFGRIPEYIYSVSYLYGASKCRRFFKLEMAWIMTGLVEGLKSAAPLAVIGSIIAEYVSPTEMTKAGLGTAIASNKLYVGKLLFLSIFTTLLGCTIFFILMLIHFIIKRRLRLVE
jgi:NitT/TauT family transport system permease protein